MFHFLHYTLGWAFRAFTMKALFVVQSIRRALGLKKMGEKRKKRKKEAKREGHGERRKIYSKQGPYGQRCVLMMME